MRGSKKDRVFERRRQLEVLVAVADAGSLSGVARALGTAQPNLSRIIAEIENNIGAKLFERRHNGVQPTIVGAVAVEQARVILLELEVADEMVGRVRDVFGAVESGDGGE